MVFYPLIPSPDRPWLKLGALFKCMIPVTIQVFNCSGERFGDNQSSLWRFPKLTFIGCTTRWRRLGVNRKFTFFFIILNMYIIYNLYNIYMYTVIILWDRINVNSSLVVGQSDEELDSNNFRLTIGNDRKASENKTNVPRLGIFKLSNKAILSANMDMKSLNSCRNSWVDTEADNNLSTSDVSTIRGRWNRSESVDQVIS